MKMYNRHSRWADGWEILTTLAGRRGGEKEIAYCPSRFVYALGYRGTDREFNTADRLLGYCQGKGWITEGDADGLRPVLERYAGEVEIEWFMERSRRERNDEEAAADGV